MVVEKHAKPWELVYAGPTKEPFGYVDPFEKKVVFGRPEDLAHEVSHIKLEHIDSYLKGEVRGDVEFRQEMEALVYTAIKYGDYDNLDFMQEEWVATFDEWRSYLERAAGRLLKKGFLTSVEVRDFRRYLSESE